MEEYLVKCHSDLPFQPGSVYWDNDTPASFRGRNIPTEFQQFIGIDPTYDHTSHITQWLNQVQHLDARTAFRQLTGDGELLTPPPLPHAVAEVPPDTPTAYSDGAFANPKQPIYGLATAAVWWPARVAPPTSVECDYASCEKRAFGLALVGFFRRFYFVLLAY